MAESPIITCPECRKKFKGKGNLEGKKIKCPQCAKAFVVPGAKKVDAIQLAAGAGRGSCPRPETQGIRR